MKVKGTFGKATRREQTRARMAIAKLLLLPFIQATKLDVKTL